MNRRPPLPKHRVGEIRTLIVDDSEAVCTSLVSFLAWVPRLKIIGIAGDGRQALALAAQRRPHLVLMDMSMPILGGFEATRIFRRRFPRTRIIMMTIHDGTEFRARSVQAGAHAFVSKVELTETLVAVIERLFRPRRKTKNKPKSKTNRGPSRKRV
jgi:DNA-binding NarL/FixJ family response regulator